MATRNWWSLNVDEAVVAGRLQTELKNEGYQVFFPLSSQFPGIDLILYNVENGRVITIQVKGSKSYEASEEHVRDFGAVGMCWIDLPKKNLETRNVKYYAFLVHLQGVEGNKLVIKPFTFVIPTDKLKEICSHKDPGKNGIYRFEISINPDRENGKAIDSRAKPPQDFWPYFEGFDKMLE